MRKLPVEGDAPILDVCTGTGDLALAFYKANQGRVPIVGADFCPEMLAVGERKRKKAGIGNQLAFVEADAQQLPFSDDQFQIAAVAFGLRNVRDTDQGIREMVRVCRPQGKVAILEFSKPSRQPFKMVYLWYFRHLLPRIGQLLSGNHQEAYNYLPQSVHEFPSGEALAQRMRDAGLNHVSYYPLTMGVATLYIGTK